MVRIMLAPVGNDSLRVVEDTIVSIREWEWEEVRKLERGIE